MVDDPRLARLLALVLPYDTALCEYDAVHPGLGDRIERMCRAELAHHDRIGSPTPIEDAAHALCLAKDGDSVLANLTWALFVHRQEES